MTRNFNEKNGRWLGDSVGYASLHMWVKSHLGQPPQCMQCTFKSDNNRLIHWANKSGEYKRDLDDWIRLCAKCHSRYDYNRRSAIRVDAAKPPIWVKEYESGMSTHQIAKKYSVSSGTVWQYLKKLSKLRSPSQAKMGSFNPNWKG